MSQTNGQNLRFLSLDVFRGMTICFMIIVNTPGSGATPFAPLNHANWHGFTPTDLVFPSFLFAVGNAMSFSLDKYKLISNSSFLKKIVKRALLIFLLGFLMYWFPFFRITPAGDIVGAPLSHTRILGVLQRIALCYLFASLLIHYFSTRKVAIISCLLLIGYWIVLLLFGDKTDPYGMLGNAGTNVDKFIMGENHMYHGEGIAFDPEGWLSTLPSIVNVIIGYYAGKYIQKNGKGYETIAHLLLAGALLIFLALCWNMTFPINKKLWSSSFVLLTTGLDLVIISALVYVIEIKKHNQSSLNNFFLAFGKNPLFIYLLSEILVIILYTIPSGQGKSLHSSISINVFQAIVPGALGSFLFAICFMLLCWLVGYWLNKKKIYIRV